MNTRLSQLPQEKQDELALITDIKKEGIQLHCTRKHHFGATKSLSPNADKKSPKKTSTNGSRRQRHFTAPLNAASRLVNISLLLLNFTKPPKLTIQPSP